MKTRKMKTKKMIMSLMLIAVMLVASTAFAFAAETNPQTTAAHLTMPTTLLDFTVTQKINMTGATDSVNLTCDSLQVTNNNTIGVLNIDSVAVTGVDGWTIVAVTTDFTKLAVDSKKVSLTANETHDMAAAYTAAGTVDPKATTTVTFAGKTGRVSTAITDLKVADVVTTVSVK